MKKFLSLVSILCVLLAFASCKNAGTAELKNNRETVTAVVTHLDIGHSPNNGAVCYCSVTYQYNGEQHGAVVRCSDEQFAFLNEGDLVNVIINGNLVLMGGIVNE